MVSCHAVTVTAEWGPHNRNPAVHVGEDANGNVVFADGSDDADDLD